MNPNFVSTFVAEPWVKKQGNAWISEEVMLATMRASVESVNNHYGVRPIIFADTVGAGIIKRLNLPCDVEVAHDGLFMGITTRFWALTKIATYGLQSQPFVHFDLDGKHFKNSGIYSRKAH